MIDSQLEQSLRDLYRDSTAAVRVPDRLRVAVAAIPAARPEGIVRARRNLLTLLVAAALTALVAGTAILLGVGGPNPPAPLVPTASPAGPSPTAIAAPTSDFRCPDAAASPSEPTASAGASLPTVPTRTVTMQRLEDAPPNGASIVNWAGGYLGLWEPGDPHFSEAGTAVGGFPVDAWFSGNGQTWTALPQDTFGFDNFAFGAAPLGDGVVVVTESPSGRWSAWFSRDAATWTLSTPPAIQLSRGLYPWPPLQLADEALAGADRGVVGLIGSGDPGLNIDPTSVAFSADGQAWQSVTLPGVDAGVAGVATFGSGFVALGTSGPQREPTSWSSQDGLHWTATIDQARPGEEFGRIYGAAGGLVAWRASSSLPCPGPYLTSRDGQTWTDLPNPLGLDWHDGYFQGDGERLLWYPTSGGLTYLTSVDGTNWTQLVLAGVGLPPETLDAPAFVMRDGILLISKLGPDAWFGSFEP